MRGRILVSAVVLASSCGEAGRSLLVLDVDKMADVPDVDRLQVEVASAGITREFELGVPNAVGIYLPPSFSGDLTAVVRGYRAAEHVGHAVVVTSLSAGEVRRLPALLAPLGAGAEPGPETPPDADVDSPVDADEDGIAEGADGIGDGRERPELNPGEPRDASTDNDDGGADTPPESKVDASGTCDPVGQTCVTGMMCGIACMPVSLECQADPGGTAMHGDLCGVAAPCAKGALCSGGAGSARCRKFCRSGTDCPPGRICEATNITCMMGEPPLVFGLCL